MDEGLVVLLNIFIHTPIPVLLILQYCEWGYMVAIVIDLLLNWPPHQPVGDLPKLTLAAVHHLDGSVASSVALLPPLWLWAHY